MEKKLKNTKLAHLLYGIAPLLHAQNFCDIMGDTYFEKPFFERITMHISKMIQGAVWLVTALFATQMTNIAVACDACLVHKVVPVPAAPESSVVLAQPGIFPIAVACIIGFVLMFAVAYGVKRAFLARA